MALNLEELGISQNDLVERVVERLADRICGEDNIDSESAFASRAFQSVTKHCEQFFDQAVAKHFEAHVLPRAAEMLETLTFQQTNSWGEKTANKLTLREYLVARAEKWLGETVNYEGKPKGQDSYSWTGTQTRLAHMVHQHLHYEIQNAIKSALVDANSRLVTSLADTCKIKLNEIASALKVQVTSK